MYDFYVKNCIDLLVDNSKESKLTAKYVYQKLINLEDENFHPKYQILDTINRCKYIITKNLTIVPVRSSGSLYNLRIIKNIDNYLIDPFVMINKLDKLNSKTKSDLNIKPIGIYYIDKIRKNNYCNFNYVK